ncbi:MAG: hypothetical protein QM770_09015 [Tepidisphaeraceae bacterium]
MSLAGCSGPNKGNIDLRKTIQQKDDVIAQKDREITSHVARIKVLEASKGTLPTLPQDRLDRLFTTTDIHLTRLTLPIDSDPNTPGDEGFKLAFVPVDQTDQEFKTAGSATIELFDLSAKDTRIGTWKFTTAELMPKYFTSVLLSCYVLEFKWQTPPTHAKLLVKVSFTEELTGKTFEGQRELTVTPPGATGK